MRRGNIDIVKLLLEKGASTTYFDSENRTALDLAKELRKEEIAKVLEHYYRNNDIITSVEANDLALTKKLLEDGANIKAKNQRGWSLVSIAEANGSVSMINLLLTYGASANE